MALLFNVAFTLSDDDYMNEEETTATVEVDEEKMNTLDESKEPSSLRGTSRFLAQQKPKKQLSCNKFPRICRSKGSPGPDCCKKKCVNVKTDGLNCGMCGNKCKYSQICCGGKCINPSMDKRNCGGCNKGCNKGEFCSYGMCNYA
ncbi:Stigma-specific protein stig1 [Thalictrum thalictroides]|uniref:Stigma-specific protein stig1 n=1 Tax=Thalictrum thalictroides TaxID=46969 RepID=A0A7J6WF68_THATH|nr:Stigma-specific protein stig1 [Thalictrum thalictroides]